MQGTRPKPSCLAASIRACPAMTSPDVLTSTGIRKPKVEMLAASLWICRRECDRAFRGYGRSCVGLRYVIRNVMADRERLDGGRKAGSSFSAKLYRKFLLKQ